MSDTPEAKVEAPLSPSRAEFLTEFLAQDSPPAEASPPAQEQTEATEQPQEAAEEDGEDTAPVEAAAEEPVKQEEAEQVDPQTAKRLEAINRQERRAKEGLAKERAELERQLQEWAPRIKAAEAFESLRARVRYEPARVLEELGLSAEDFEPAARDLYSRSPKAAETPALREQAARTLREREAMDRVTAAEQRAAAVEQRLQQMVYQQQAQAYMATVAESVSDESPVVKAMMTNDRQEAMGALTEMAQHLLQEYGETPDPADVVRELEKLEVARAKKRGFATPTTKTNTPVAGEQRTAPKTLTNQLTSTTTPPRATPQSRKEAETDVLKALESGRLE